MSDKVQTIGAQPTPAEALKEILSAIDLEKEKVQHV